MMMDQEIKKEWVEALRSGEYSQGIGSLRREGNYCCLGVLCDVAAKHGIGSWIGPMEGEEADGFWCNSDGMAGRSFPTDRVFQWAGFKDGVLLDHPRAGYEEGETLVAFNDNYKFTFDEIADLIEEQL